MFSALFFSLFVLFSSFSCEKQEKAYFKLLFGVRSTQMLLVEIDNSNAYKFARCIKKLQLKYRTKNYCQAKCQNKFSFGVSEQEKKNSRH